MKMNVQINKTAILFLLLFTCLTVGAQTIIKGTVLNTSAEPIVGSIIMVEGTAFGAASNAFGEYRIDVKTAGNYSLEVKAISYATQKISGIEVATGKELKVDIILQSESFMVGGGVEIKDFRKTSSEAAVIMEMREAKGVVSGVGAVQIQKHICFPFETLLPCSSDLIQFANEFYHLCMTVWVSLAERMCYYFLKP